MFLQAYYDEIELQKISYDVMAIMSPKNVIKKRHKIFPFWAPPIKISGYASGHYQYFLF